MLILYQNLVQLRDKLLNQDPGLIVCLSVGLSFGKGLASTLGIPFIGINHLEGHALSPKLHDKIDYPYLLLLISGGLQKSIVEDKDNQFYRGVLDLKRVLLNDLSL